MRALNKSWIGILLVILFGASLFFFRGSSRYSNLFNSDNFVANVSGTQISTSQFLRALELNIGQFAQMIGEQLTGDQIRAFQIHQLVLQNLVSKAIFENEFDRINYILDDTVVANKTKDRFPNLYINNKINDEALNTFLRQQRLKIEDLVNIINYETRANVFDNLVFEKNYPNAFANKINLFNDQTRNINLLKVPFKNINLPNFSKSNITKNDPNLIEFFENNKLNYMTQEKRDATYIVINKESFKKNFIPSEFEVSEYYINNKDQFIIPEKRSFIQFNFKSKEEAENFKIKINELSNEEVISYATDKNITFNRFTDLDKNQVLDELSNVIFELNKNDISEVVTTALAHHIIILEDISLQKEQPLNEVSKDIVNSITNVQVDNYYYDLKLKINQQILDGFSMNEIATNNKLFTEKIDKVLLNNQEDDEFLNTIKNSIFDQTENFISDVIDYDTNKSFIINVEKIYPSKVEELETVFDTLLFDFIKSKKINYSKELFDKANKENSLKTITDELGLNTEKVKVKLDSVMLPAQLISSIFDSKVNKVTYSFDTENVYFANIESIEIADNVITFEDVNLISELKNAFGSELIKTKKISRNDELINGLISQYK